MTRTRITAPRWALLLVALGLLTAPGLAEEGEDETERLARMGDAAAQDALGDMYRFGLGVPKDDQEAVKWYRKAAEQGNAPAQSSLGSMYSKGEGVPKDHQEAVKWYRKAAEQGDAGAQVILAVMYEDGWGVPKDYIQAHAWWNLFAAQGGENASEWRDKLAAKMSSEQIAKAQELAAELLQQIEASKQTSP